MKKGFGKRFVAGIILGLIVGGVVILITTFARFWEDYENKTYDLRYSLFIGPPREFNLEDVVIVSVDTKSLDILGKFGKWPRFYYAQVIQNLFENGARAVGFDLLFSEPEAPREEIIALFKETRAGKITQFMVDSLKMGGNPSAIADATIGEILKSMEYDTEMGEMTGNAGNVFYGFEFLLGSNARHSDTLLYSSRLPIDQRVAQTFRVIHRRERDYPLEDVEIPIPPLVKNAKGVGYVNAEPDPDGVIRSVPLILTYNGNVYPHLGLRLAMEKLGVKLEDVKVYPGKYLDFGDLKIPINKDGRMLIRYFGNSLKFKYISFFDVFVNQTDDEKPLEPSLFKDKVVMIGATAAGLGDLKAVPFTQTFPGVEIYANIIHGITKGAFIRKINLIFSLGIVLGVGILCGVLAMVFKPKWSVILLLLLLLGYLYYSLFLLRENGIWIEVVRPVGSLFFTFMATMTYRYITEERKAMQIRGMFSTYMSPALVNKLIEHPEMLKLGGENKEITVFFSDVQGFTTISEAMSPPELVSLLNEYLTCATDTIFEFNGYVDKYEGDAIMAFWGAPVDQPDHATQCVLCILEMRNRLSVLNASLVAKGLPALLTRFGINTGLVTIGNMGSKEKFAFTAMGDPVNQAARFEPANKEYGTYCMMGESTYEKVKDVVEVRELDLLQVKGKTKGVRVYELLSKKDKLDVLKKKVVNAYNIGMNFYKARKWDDGILSFQAALKIDPEDGPSKTYLKRCQVFKESPPPADWDGVFVMKTKG